MYSNAKPQHAAGGGDACRTLAQTRTSSQNSSTRRAATRGQKILGRVLEDFVLTDDGICYSTVSQQLLEEFGATHEDLEDVVGALRAVDHCEVAALLKESPDGTLPA